MASFVKISDQNMDFVSNYGVFTNFHTCGFKANSETSMKCCTKVKNGTQKRPDTFCASKLYLMLLFTPFLIFMSDLRIWKVLNYEKLINLTSFLFMAIYTQLMNENNFLVKYENDVVLRFETLCFLQPRGILITIQHSVSMGIFLEPVIISLPHRVLQYTQ